MKSKLFAYGTLQVPEIMTAVAGRLYPAHPACLHGYARYSLKDGSYPGIRPQSGALTLGILYTGVDARSLRRLDRYEDDFYRRQTLAVTTSSGETALAQVYVVAPEQYELLASRPWNLDDFMERSLAGFRSRRWGERKIPMGFMSTKKLPRVY